MAQDYKLLQFKVGDFQDQHGNTWATAAFEGVSEPVRWVVKDPSTIKEQESYYGDIKQHESKSGRPYLRFHRAKKEDRPKRDDSAIRAQWAIGQAVNTLTPLIAKIAGKADETFISGIDAKFLEDVELKAKAFYAMVDRVKGSEAPKEEPKKTGYDVFKENRPSKHDDRDEDREFASLMQKGLETGEEINLDEIPF